MIMQLMKDENNKQFVKMYLYSDLVDELFIVKTRAIIKDLEEYLDEPSAAHPEDLKVYTEQIAAHRKILEWHTPNDEWESQKVLYVGYKFDITGAGILFVDSNTELEPYDMMKMPEGYKVGDTFILCQTKDGNIFLKKSQFMKDEKKIKSKPNPVKKNMDKFHKPATHKDESKYDRKDYKQEQRKVTDLNWDGE